MTEEQFKALLGVIEAVCRYQIALHGDGASSDEAEAERVAVDKLYELLVVDKEKL